MKTLFKTIITVIRKAFGVYDQDNIEHVKDAYWKDVNFIDYMYDHSTSLKTGQVLQPRTVGDYLYYLDLINCDSNTDGEVVKHYWVNLKKITLDNPLTIKYSSLQNGTGAALGHLYEYKTGKSRHKLRRV